MLARGRRRGCPAGCAPLSWVSHRVRQGLRPASRAQRPACPLAPRPPGTPASPWVWSSSARGRLGVRRGRSRRARSSWTRLRPGERALAYMNAARMRVHPGDSAFTCSEARPPGRQRVHLLRGAFTWVAARSPGRRSRSSRCPTPTWPPTGCATSGRARHRSCPPPPRTGRASPHPSLASGPCRPPGPPGTTRRRRGSGSRTCAASSRGARCSPSTRRSSPPAR